MELWRISEPLYPHSRHKGTIKQLLHKPLKTKKLKPKNIPVL
jgi:hypothetical protein